MNVGFDIDGTITAAPKVYARLGSCLLRCGDHVYVITGAVPASPEWHKTPAGRQRQLEELGLKVGKHYDRVVVCVGEDRHDVARKKRDVCNELGIELMVDDDPIYLTEIRKATYALDSAQ